MLARHTIEHLLAIQSLRLVELSKHERFWSLLSTLQISIQFVEVLIAPSFSLAKIAFERSSKRTNLRVLAFAISESMSPSLEMRTVDCGLLAGP